MNEQQAIIFINKLFDDVWAKLDETQMPNYYHKNLQIYMNLQIVAGYDSIVTRLRSIKAKYCSVINKIEDILVDGNKMVVSLSQSFFKSPQDNPETYLLMFIYEILDNKISKIYVITNPSFNFLED